MSDSEMDDIIRKAASEYHPAYDDKAWQHMELLLDKHLPIKKKKDYRIVLLLILLILGGGGTWLVTIRGHISTSPAYQAGQQVIAPNAKPAITSNINSTIEPSASTENINKRGGQANTAIAPREYSTSGNGSNAEVNGINEVTTPSAAERVIIKNKRSQTNIHTEQALVETNNEVAVSENAKTIKENITKSRDDKEVIPNKDVALNNDNTSNDNSSSKIVAELPKKELPKTVNENDKKAKHVIVSKKSKGGFSDNFGLTLSAGPDASFIRTRNFGSVTAVYGGGVSYKVSGKLTLQTGFYVSNKIYSADSAQYHPPKEFWGYYPDVKHIYANCKVYEIPLLVSYNFKPVGRHNWFITTGLSTFLMKTETYTYEYMPAYGQLMEKSYTISNQNKHYFSVLNLAGGYQYNLNKHFSFSGMPYIKVPLTGIGFGAVKLNSTGGLFTATLRPFAK